MCIYIVSMCLCDGPAYLCAKRTGNFSSAATKTNVCFVEKIKFIHILPSHDLTQRNKWINGDVFFLEFMD